MLLVEVGRLVGESLEALGSVQQRRATARDDSLLHGRTRRVEGVGHAVLLLVHLHLRGAADLKHGHAARQLGQALLQLLLLVLRGGGGDRLAQQLAPLLDRFLSARTIEHDGVILRDGDALAGAQHAEISGLQLEAHILRDDSSAREDGHVLQGRLAVVAEARRLHRRDVHTAAQLVDDERREGLAVHVLRHNDEWLLSLHHLLEQREHRLQRRHFLLDEEDQRVLELSLLRLRRSDEVRRDVATVKLHALNDLELVLEGLTVLYRDDTLLAHLLHSIGDQLADRVVRVSRDGGHVLDLLLGRNHLRAGLEVLEHMLDGKVDATPKVHGVHARGDGLAALRKDRAREDGGGRRAVARDIVRLVRHLTHELRADVLVAVLELDRLGDGHAVLGDLGRAVRLVNHDVPPLGPEGHLHGVGELVDAGEHHRAGLVAEADVFPGHQALGDAREAGARARGGGGPREHGVGGQSERRGSP
mmetsp:Transcript_41831/g.73608  ORF Transcript_41831/g.73608 Transcript_41831/m.73608 type:complete len:475 (+) Transcript_41831:632-2056(+)